jgi:RNA recognition motif-containing protein
MNIYVGNMPYNSTEKELEDMFGEFGTVTSARIITDRETGKSKGFGFVEMSNNDEAEEAIRELNGKELGGRNIKVNEARPREERPRRRPRT